MKDKLSERRLKENEVIFMRANKGVADFIEEETGHSNVIVAFYCECSNLDCRDRIKINTKLYKKLHKNPKHFIALPGHEFPNIERIIKKEKGFNILEKIGDVPSARDVEITITNAGGD